VVFELQSSELLKKTGKSDLQIASFLKKLKHNVSSSMHEYQKKIDVNIEVKAIRLQQGKEHANV
jgi:two-component sensor histidine kinase